MSFVAFAWIASILFGLVAIIGKLTSKYAIQNIWLFNFFWNLFSLCITALLALLNHVGLPNTWENILFASFFYSLFGLLYIIGLSKLDISVFSPLFNFRTAFGVILGIAILGEKLSFFQLGLVGIISIAGMFVSIEEKFTLKSFFTFGIGIAIASTFFYSISNIFINKSLINNGYWEVNLFVALFTQLFLLTTAPLFIKDLKKLTFNSVSSTFAMSLALALGTIAANKAYAENVSISTTITALPVSMIMAFLFSIFAPQLLEKHTLKVYAIRFTAAAVMIISALKLS